jgi:hypothetical protein
LALLSILGIILLFNKDLDPATATYEVIIFIFAIICVVTAVISQVEAYHSEKAIRKMLHELKVIDNEVNEEYKLDKSLRKKIDEILTLDRKIYNQLNKKGKKK